MTDRIHFDGTRRNGIPQHHDQTEHTEIQRRGCDTCGKVAGIAITIIVAIAIIVTLSLFAPPIIALIAIAATSVVSFALTWIILNPCCRGNQYTTRSTHFFSRRNRRPRRVHSVHTTNFDHSAARVDRGMIHHRTFSHVAAVVPPFQTTHRSDPTRSALCSTYRTPIATAIVPPPNVRFENFNRNRETGNIRLRTVPECPVAHAAGPLPPSHPEIRQGLPSNTRSERRANAAIVRATAPPLQQFRAFPSHPEVRQQSDSQALATALRFDAAHRRRPHN